MVIIHNILAHLYYNLYTFVEITKTEHMKLFIVDAFSSSPFGGNQAGVVLLGENEQFPAEETMIKIAAELRYSETAFVKQKSRRDFVTRYFTPCSEVNLCGHATIATFSVLENEGIVQNGDECVNSTLAGDLRVIIGEDILMEMAKPEMIEKELDTETLYKIMGASPHDTLAPKVVSTGLPDIILPVSTLEELDSLAPDMEELSRISEHYGVVGVHAFAIADDDSTAHTRNFAPLYGVPEESATGTANGALAQYLHLEGIAKKGEKCIFIQGEKMGRPSGISVEITANGEIYVGGSAHIIAKGELYI